MNWKKQSGILLILTSIIHNIIGIIIFWEPLVDIFHAGLFNTIAFHYDRATIFWFLFSGVLMFIIGHLMHWLANDLGRELPKFLGWYMLWISIVGAFFMPISGFWLLLPQALIILKK